MKFNINQNDIFKESSEGELDKLENIKFWRKARDRKKKKKTNHSFMRSCLRLKK